MSGQSKVSAVEPPVSWRDGVHIDGTAIWCDARRARDVCFVSAAHAIASPRHGQLIASAATLALLQRSDRRAQPASQLAVPYGHPFTLGTRRVELFRSGHCLGSASVLVTVDDARVVYAGAVGPTGSALGGAADLRSCDVLVVDASYGDPSFSFSDPGAIEAEVAAHARAITSAGGVAVLLVSSPAKGLDVAARLAAIAPELPLAAHRDVHHAAQRVRDLAEASALGPLRRHGRALRPGEVLLWPVRARDKLDAAALPQGSSVALVSGAAEIAGAVEAAGADTGFAWSNRADAAGLLEYIGATGARAVYLIGGGSDAFVDELAAGGRQVTRLAAPAQMPLF